MAKEHNKHRHLPSVAIKEYDNAYLNFIGYVKAISTETNANKNKHIKEYATKYIQYLNACSDVPAHDVRHHAYALASLLDCSPDDFGSMRYDPVEHPKQCNICGGEVIFTSNAEVYCGQEYGSGRCYLCTKCGAYVGTHALWPDEALGILADSYMRTMKKKCHAEFDKLWKPSKDGESRTMAYEKLASRMGISPYYCHFGLFDRKQLNLAYKILTCGEVV